MTSYSDYDVIMTSYLCIDTFSLHIAGNQLVIVGKLIKMDPPLCPYYTIPLPKVSHVLMTG